MPTVLICTSMYDWFVQITYSACFNFPARIVIWNSYKHQTRNWDPRPSPPPDFRSDMVRRGLIFSKLLLLSLNRIAYRNNHLDALSQTTDWSHTFEDLTFEDSYTKKLWIISYLPVPYEDLLKL